MTAPGVAPTNSFDAEPRSTAKAMVGNRFVGVERARRRVATRGRSSDRPRSVQRNKPPRDAGHLSRFPLIYQCFSWSQRVDHAIRHSFAERHLDIRQSLLIQCGLSGHPLSRSVQLGGGAEDDCVRPRYRPCVKSRTPLGANLFRIRSDIGSGDLETSRCPHQQTVLRWFRDR